MRCLYTLLPAPLQAVGCPAPCTLNPCIAPWFLHGDLELRCLLPLPSPVW